MSVEHIAPQKPKDGAPLPNAGKLGNLLLVPGNLNSEVLENKPFAAKKKIFKARHLPLDDVLAAAQSWDEARIDKRTAWLATFVQEKVCPV